MAFKHYLEEEDDKPYFTTNSLGYYYDKMEGFAEKVEQAAKILNVTKEEVEKNITAYIEQNKNELDQRLAQWDGKLETFDSSVETLLTEWVDDGTLTPLIDTTLIDQKISPIALQLAEKVSQTELQAVASGSPKGTYPTKADLETAYPAGNTNIYVVSADGKWYYWNGSAWTAGGTYQAALSSFNNMLTNSNVTTSHNSTNTNERLHIKSDGTIFHFAYYSATGSQVLNIKQGHKYYAKFGITQASTGLLGNNIRFYYADGVVQTALGDVSVDKKDITGVVVADKTLQANIAFQAATVGSYERKNQMLVDLTTLFGVGSEPTKEEFEELLETFPNKWFGNATQFNTVQQSLLNYYLKASKKVNEVPPLVPTADSIGLKVLSRNEGKLMLWYDTDKRIIYATEGSLADLERTKLFASYDYGQSWEEKYSSQYSIRKFKTLKSGFHLMWMSSGKIRRLNPDFTFSSDSSITVFQPLISENGIADDGNGTIMFTEYSASTGEYNCNIYKSVNDGATWTVSRTGADIRHWHSVQVDPYTGHFWACAGDAGLENKILISTDKGVTWTVKSEGTQQDRAVGLAFTYNDVYWAADTTVSPKIMVADKATWTKIVIADVPNNASTLGVSKTIDGSIVGWTRTETTNTGVELEYAFIWVVKDKTLKKVHEFSVKNGLYGGFTIASAVDSDNVLFLLGGNTVLGGTLGLVLPFTS